MKHAEQVAQTRKLFRYLDEKSTSLAEDCYRNNVSDYTCEHQARLEQELLFRRYPLLVGLSDEIREPGDYLTDDFSGVPLLVTRDADGQVKAFMNVCRHRGSRLVVGRGGGKGNFTCPYHAWCYGLDGSLRAIPFDSAFTDVDRATHGLRALPVIEKYGMVWVMPTPESPLNLDEHLAEATEDLEAFDFGTYSHFETRTLHANLNWKLVIDTFLETYHLSVLHKLTIAPILHSNLATFDAMGNNLRMIGARKTISTLRESPEAEWDLVKHSAIVYVLFPNTVMVQQGDHLETWRVYPDGGPNKSKMHVSLYTPEPSVTEKAKAYWDKNMKLLMATVQEEDFPLAENAQKDFYSGAQDAITFGRNEPALAHFHTRIRAVLDGTDHQVIGGAESGAERS